MFGWKNLGMQARFVAIAAIGVLALAAGAIGVIGWSQFASVETKLRGLSENELISLEALVETAMQSRVDDPQDVAIKVFNGWFESRNKDYAGKLWSVWSPKVTAFMAQTYPDRAPKKVRDAIDEEAMRTGRSVGRFVDGAYRYSLPIVLGKTMAASKDICESCHGGAMDIKDGEVIAVFSSSLSTAQDFSALRQLLIALAIGVAVFGLIMILVSACCSGR